MKFLKLSDRYLLNVDNFVVASPKYGILIYSTFFEKYKEINNKHLTDNLLKYSLTINEFFETDDIEDKLIQVKTGNEEIIIINPKAVVEIYYGTVLLANGDRFTFYNSKDLEKFKIKLTKNNIDIYNELIDEFNNSN